MVQTLVSAGVRNLFALSGNHIMSVFDAALDRDLNLIHVRHEAAAVHMADAWGRLTGEPGVALVTGGPGHANAVSALYTARCSQSPLVLLSGHAPLKELGRGAFQEMQQAEVARPLTKASWTIGSASHIGSDVAKALRVARSGAPGPVHVSLPSDLLESEAQKGQSDFQYEEPCAPATHEVAAALEALSAAERPLVICGPSAATPRGREKIAGLMQASSIPFLALESPRGVNDPSLGRLSGVLRIADAVLLLGMRLDFMLRFGSALASDCRLTSLGEEINVLSVLDQLLPLARTSRSGDWAQHVVRELAYRPEEWKSVQTKAGARVHPLDVCREAQRLLDSSAHSVLVCDGGEFGQWAQAAVRANERLINGPAGAIGASIPFAISACLARRGAPVVAMMGDGTFGFHMAEFDTACRYSFPIIAIVGNDARWNSEYQIQLRNYGAARAAGCELMPSRYDLVVEALGGHGEYVTELAQLAAAMGRAFDSRRPACVNVLIDGQAAPLFQT